LNTRTGARLRDYSVGRASLHLEVHAGRRGLAKVLYSKVRGAPKYKCRCNLSKIQRKKYAYHGENPPMLVCKLVADEGGKPDVLENMLSGGLCGIVAASGCGSGRDRHSAADVGGTDTISVGILFADVSTSSVSLLSGMTWPCMIISNPCGGILNDGSPGRALRKEVGDDVTRISEEASESNEG